MTMTDNNTDAAPLPDVLLAETALAMSEAGDLIIIDVRNPNEWMRSGVAQGALTITPQNPSFMQDLHDAVGGDLNKPIALICATGTRTAAIQRFLREQGYGAVSHIAEGMMGNFSAAGWLRKELPTVQYRP